jgi:hypothetical protein
MTRLTLIGATLGSLWLSGCCDWGVDGNGDRSDERREVEAFTRVRAEVDLDVKIVQGDDARVVVSLDSNLQKYVSVHVSEGALFVEQDESFGETVSGPHVRITVPELTAAKLAGAGDLSVTMNQPSLPLDLFLSGSGDLRFTGETAAIGAYLSGSGDLSLSGETSDVDIGLEGSGDIRARDLRAESANIELEGSGDISATVTESARVTLSGSGDVDLYGGADLEVDHSGSGDVHRH